MKIGIAVLIIAAVWLRALMLYEVRYDMETFLLPWYEHLKDSDISGILTVPSDYNFIYIFLMWLLTRLPISPVAGIKLLTFIFDFALIGLVYHIVRTLARKNGARLGRPEWSKLAVLLLFIPTLLFNGAFLGQCDMIFTFFLLCSWWTITRGRPWLGWTMFGIALAFKLQAVFFLPFLGYWWLTHNKLERSSSWRESFRKNRKIFAPIASALVFLPQGIATAMLGGSFWQMVTVYTNQAGQYGDLSLHAVNYLSLINAKENSHFAQTLLTFGLVVLICIAIGFALFGKKTNQKERYILPLLLLTAAPFFLPHMHERYFFTAEIFAVVFAFILRERWAVVVALVLQITGLAANIGIFLDSETYYAIQEVWIWLVVMQFSVIAFLAYKLFRSPPAVAIRSSA